MDWIEAYKYLAELINMYQKIPYESGWFVLSQLKKLNQRYSTGERTEQLYKEIMAME